MSLETQHDEMVAALSKPGEDILATLTPAKVNLLHHSYALPIETCELNDAIKKFLIYNKELDFENVVEELGDIEFYLKGIRQALGISRELTLQANIDKLAVRYHEGKYSDKQAQDRADKEADDE